jgi:DNA-binding transcriptional LysR family regulator
MDLLRALSTFNRIVETGSFSAVARETNSSQSAVTRLIDQLETHFRLRLFHRTTRHLSLTDDGQDLLGHARQLLEKAADMEGALGSHLSAPTGLVRVGLSAAASINLVPRMGVLFERYPGLSVELVVRDSFADLVEERLDVAVQAGQPSDASVVVRMVGTLGRVPVASLAYLERSFMRPVGIARSGNSAGRTGRSRSLFRAYSAPTIAAWCIALPWRDTVSPFCGNNTSQTTSARGAYIRCCRTIPRSATTAT